VPAGTLRQAVTYPFEGISPDQIGHALAAVGLGQLLPQIDVDAPWDRVLSEGEKQRLAVARLLLHRPDLIVLDEATSALHVAGQAEIMALVARELPGATVISVGHRPELEAFHDRKLVLARRPDGATIARDAPIRGAGRIACPPLVPSRAGTKGPPLRLV
jgi:putative ATP-binding cassette transporter